MITVAVELHGRDVIGGWTAEVMTIQINIFTITISIEESILFVAGDAGLGIAHLTAVVFVIPFVSTSVQLQIAQSSIATADGLSVQVDGVTFTTTIIGLAVICR